MSVHRHSVRSCPAFALGFALGAEAGGVARCWASAGFCRCNSDPRRLPGHRPGHPLGSWSGVTWVGDGSRPARREARQKACGERSLSAAEPAPSGGHGAGCPAPALVVSPAVDGVVYGVFGAAVNGRRSSSSASGYRSCSAGSASRPARCRRHRSPGRMVLLPPVGTGLRVVRLAGPGSCAVSTGGCGVRRG